MATFTYPTSTSAYNGGQPAVGRDVRDDLDAIRNFVVGKNLEGSNIADDTVALANLTTAVQESLLFTGVVIPYANATAPSGWLICDGQAVSRVTYADLFALIGTTYGAGDSVSTFNVPDLRAKFPMGLNDAATPNGVDGSLTARALADEGGAETSAALVAHTHTQSAHTHGLNSHFHYMFTTEDQTTPPSPTPGEILAGPESAVAYNSTPAAPSPYIMRAGSNPSVASLGRTSPASGSTGSGGGGPTDSAGSGASFSIENPFLAVNYIIKT